MTPIYFGEENIASAYKGSQSLAKLFYANVTISGVTTTTTTTTTTLAPCSISHNTSTGSGNSGTAKYYLEINLCTLPTVIVFVLGYFKTINPEPPLAPVPLRLLPPLLSL
jgi:hypothetical protein